MSNRIRYVTILLSILLIAITCISYCSTVTNSTVGINKTNKTSIRTIQISIDIIGTSLQPNNPHRYEVLSCLNRVLILLNSFPNVKYTVIVGGQTPGEPPAPPPIWKNGGWVVCFNKTSCVPVRIVEAVYSYSFDNYPADEVMSWIREQASKSWGTAEPLSNMFMVDTRLNWVPGAEHIIIVVGHYELDLDMPNWIINNASYLVNKHHTTFIIFVATENGLPHADFPYWYNGRKFSPQDVINIYDEIAKMSNGTVIYYSCDELINYLLSRILIVTRPTLMVWGQLEIPYNGNLTQLLNKLSGLKGKNYTIGISGFKIKITEARGVLYRSFGIVTVYGHGVTTWGWGIHKNVNVYTEGVNYGEYIRGVKAGSVDVIFNDYFAETGVKDISVKWLVLGYVFQPIVFNPNVNVTFVLPGAPTVNIVFPPSLSKSAFPNLAAVLEFHEITLIYSIGQTLILHGGLIPGVPSSWKIGKVKNNIIIEGTLGTETIRKLVWMMEHPDMVKLSEPDIVPGKGDPVTTIGGLFPVPRSSWSYLSALPLNFPKSLAPLWDAVVLSVLSHDAVDIVKICLGKNMTKDECIRLWESLMSNTAYLDNVRSRALGIWRYWIETADKEYIDKLISKLASEGKKIGIKLTITAISGLSLSSIYDALTGASSALSAAGIGALAFLLGDAVINAVYHPEWITGRTVFYGYVTIPFMLATICFAGKGCGKYLIFGETLPDIISDVQSNGAVAIRGVSADDVKNLLYTIFLQKCILTSGNTPDYILYAVDGLKVVRRCIQNINGTCKVYDYEIHTNRGWVEVESIDGTGTLVLEFTTFTQGFLSALFQLLWNWFHLHATYFYDGFRVVTHIAAIYVKYGVLKNPKIIAQIIEEMLKAKYGNLITNVTCVPKKHYALCTIYFAVPLRRFIISGLQHFIINGKIVANFVFMRNCTSVSYGNMSRAGYRCELVYYPPSKLPKNTVFKVDRIGIMAIPSPAYFIEYYWKIGKIVMSGIAWVNKTLMKKIGMIFGNSTAWQAYVHYGSLFNVNATRKVGNTTLDYFVTYNRSLIVQLGGGYLVPGSVYSFTVWRTLPLDVGIVRIFINGSLTYSTIPHDVRVAVYSTVTQDVTVRFDFYLGANVNGSLYVAYHLGNATVSFTAYGDQITLSPRVPIAGIMSKLMQYLPILSSKFNSTILIVVARIVKARYDAVKSNDVFKTWVTLPPVKSGPALLIVHVYDADTGRDINGATVTVYALPGYVKIGEEETNMSGIATFIVHMYSKYEVEVSYDDYSPYNTVIYVNNRTYVLDVPLSKSGGIPPGGGGGGGGGGGNPPSVNKYPVVVGVYYEDGTPFQGADVTVVTNYGKKFTGKTDSTGRYVVYVRKYSIINVTVRAEVDGKVYTHEWENINVTHGIYLQYIVPTYPPPPPVNKSAILVIYTVNPVDNSPVSNVVLLVKYCSKMFKVVTNSSGTAEITDLCTGKIVNVTVLKVPQGYFVTRRTYLIVLRNIINRLYIYVYKKKEIPIAYVRVLVEWEDGEPVPGAKVRAVVYYNGTSRTITGTTDSYGKYIFEVPSRSKVTIYVYVHVGNFTWSSNRTIIAVGYVTVKFIVPRYSPPPPKHGVTMYVYVYDSIGRRYVPDIDVNVYKYYNGRAVPYTSCVTNSKGYCTVKVASATYYGINITSSKYRLVLPEGWNMYITYVPPGVEKWSVVLTVVPRNVTTGKPVGNNTKPVIHKGNKTYVPLTVRVVTKDGVGVAGAYVNVTDLTNNSLIFEGWTNSDGYVPTIYVMLNHIVKICVNASRYHYYKCKIIKMDKGYFITFFVPTYSRWFKPEVAIYGLELIAPYNYTYYSNSTMLIYIIELYTNIRQRVTVTYRLYTCTRSGVPEKIVETWNRTYMLDLKQNRGSTVFYYRDTVKVPVNGSECFRLYAVISKYENDTDLSNNHAWSNIVCLSQPVDLYVTVYYRIVKRIRPGIPLNDIRIFPGDTMEVIVYVLTYNNETVRNVPYTLTVMIKSPHGGTVLRRELRGVLNGYLATYRFNITVPWDDKMSIIAMIDSPEDFNKLNNVFNMTLPIAYDVEVLRVKYPHVVISGQVFTIEIYVRKNVFDRTADVLINFTDLGVMYDYRTVLNNATTQVIKVNVRAPVIPLSLTHPIYIAHVVVKIVTLDDYPRNNIAYMTITITRRTYLLIALAIGGLALLMILIALAKHHHHAVMSRRRRRMFTLEGE